LTTIIRTRDGKVKETKNHNWNKGQYDMELNGKTLWAGHNDANKRFSGSYNNSCDVKYVKFFVNAVCTMEE